MNKRGLSDLISIAIIVLMVIFLIAIVYSFTQVLLRENIIRMGSGMNSTNFSQSGACYKINTDCASYNTEASALRDTDCIQKTTLGSKEDNFSACMIREDCRGLCGSHVDETSCLAEVVSGCGWKDGYGCYLKLFPIYSETYLINGGMNSDSFCYSNSTEDCVPGCSEGFRQRGCMENSHLASCTGVKKEKCGIGEHSQCEWREH